MKTPWKQQVPSRLPERPLHVPRSLGRVPRDQAHNHTRGLARDSLLPAMPTLSSADGHCTPGPPGAPLTHLATVDGATITAPASSGSAWPRPSSCPAPQASQVPPPVPAVPRCPPHRAPANGLSRLCPDSPGVGATHSKRLVQTQHPGCSDASGENRTHEGKLKRPSLGAPGGLCLQLRS